MDPRVELDQEDPGVWTVLQDLLLDRKVHLLMYLQLYR